MCFFFFKQKTAYEMRISDWSSDVCSSDLRLALLRACAVGAGSGSGDTLIDGRDGQQPGSTRRVRRKEPMAKVEAGDTPTGASAAEELELKLCGEPAVLERLWQAPLLRRPGAAAPRLKQLGNVYYATVDIRL